jgi:uncharacterized protein
MGQIIGVLSDSHGRWQRTRAAIAALASRGATRFVHLGDVGSEQVLDMFAGLEATVVFGNCDDEKPLHRYADFLGIEIKHPVGVVKCGDKRIGVTHGHLPEAIDFLLGEHVDYLLSGHSHEAHDQRVGSTRCMNPGALDRARRFTVLLLEPETGAAEWIEVDECDAL